MHQEVILCQKACKEHAVPVFVGELLGELVDFLLVVISVAAVSGLDSSGSESAAEVAVRDREVTEGLGGVDGPAAGGMSELRFRRGRARSRPCFQAAVVGQMQGLALRGGSWGLDGLAIRPTLLAYRVGIEGWLVGLGRIGNPSYMYLLIALALGGGSWGLDGLAIRPTITCLSRAARGTWTDWQSVLHYFLIAWHEDGLPIRPRPYIYLLTRCRSSSLATPMMVEPTCGTHRAADPPYRGSGQCTGCNGRGVPHRE